MAPLPAADQRHGLDTRSRDIPQCASVYSGIIEYKGEPSQFAPQTIGKNECPRKSSSTSDIQYLLNEYQDIFQDPKRMPPFRKGFNHKILLKEGSNPINLRPYRRIEDGGWRICVDYRSLSKSTILDRFLIPMVEDLLDELHGYYRRFVKNYGNLARPLTQFFKKDAFKWSEEAEHAFQELKEIMKHPSFSLPDSMPHLYRS
ncbi:hypothetical protein Tco_1316291 [Tanacetum coccineum]